jgi:sulfur carrier protein ThiS
MHITVKLYASMHQYQPSAPRTGLTLEVPEGSTVQDVLTRLGVPERAPVVAMINEKVEALQCALYEGDVLSLFPPVAGG